MRRGDFEVVLGRRRTLRSDCRPQALGITLPPDLEGEVRRSVSGTFDAARPSIARQVRQGSREQRATRATQVVNSQATQAQQQHLSRTIEQTVSAWGTSSVRAIRTTGARKNREELPVGRGSGKGRSDIAGARSRDRQGSLIPERQTLEQFAPEPRATRPVPSSINNRAASGARPEPRSMMEAARNSDMARARGARSSRGRGQWPSQQVKSRASPMRRSITTSTKAASSTRPFRTSRS